MRGGATLYYLSDDRSLMAVTVTWSAAFTPAPARALARWQLGVAELSPVISAY